VPRVPSVPAYRLHKPSGKAVVTIRTTAGRRDIYLGEYNSPDSRREYARIIAELEASTPARAAAVTAGNSLTVNEVLLAFMQHAAVYYRTPDGKPTSEVREMRLSLGPVRELYGLTPTAEFGAVALETVRQRMVGAGWCRNLVNRRVDRVKRVFKWAASKGLVSVTVYQTLQTLAGLRKGRTEARESKPVRPVDPAHVMATLPFLNRHLRAVVELQRYSGARPGEAWKLTLGEVDRSGEHWLYRPTQHKTTHHDKDRVIPFGPRARGVLVAFLIGDKPPPEGFDRIDLSDRTARLVAATLTRRPAGSGKPCSCVTSAGRSCSSPGVWSIRRPRCSVRGRRGRSGTGDAGGPQEQGPALAAGSAVGVPEAFPEGPVQ
jgi:integrase